MGTKRVSGANAQQRKSMSESPKRSAGLSVPLKASVIAALVLIVGSGAAYRVAAKRLASVTGGVPLERGTLGKTLPLRIGDWAGRDVPLDEEIVEKTDTDDHVRRFYVHEGSREAATLFIAYGIRLRDLMPHRPAVCYTLQGWTLDQSKELALTDASGAALPCRVQDFDRGVLQQSRMSVLHYYIVDGRAYGDVSVLRSHAWQLHRDVQYAAQIQVSAPVGGQSNPDNQAVIDFAIAAAPVIQRVIDEAVRKAVGEEGAADTQGH